MCAKGTVCLKPLRCATVEIRIKRFDRNYVFGNYNTLVKIKTVLKKYSDGFFDRNKKKNRQKMNNFESIRNTINR